MQDGFVYYQGSKKSLGVNWKIGNPIAIGKTDGTWINLFRGAGQGKIHYETLNLAAQELGGGEAKLNLIRGLINDAIGEARTASGTPGLDYAIQYTINVRTTAAVAGLVVSGAAITYGAPAGIEYFGYGLEGLGGYTATVVGVGSERGLPSVCDTKNRRCATNSEMDCSSKNLHREFKRCTSRLKSN